MTGEMRLFEGNVLEVGDCQVRVGHLSSANRFTEWNTSGSQIDAILAAALWKNTSSFYHSLRKNKYF